LAAFRACQEKAGAVGPRLDLIFTQIRIGFFYNDHELVERNMAKAKLLIEEGGDWDRRNRLKVYEALHLLRQRSFRQAAQLFAETLATFTSTEIFSYEDLVFYTVVSAIVSLDRVTLKSKLVDSPEIHTVIHKIPHLGEFLNAYYDGEYATFLEKLLDVMQLMQLDRYLSQHTHWFCREMRVRAYAQFLESYRSVQVRSMADTFGVSTQILDKELSRFISTGRLNCKIDKVGGIIETNRPDTRNAQYHSTLKQGDSLLNRLQKLSRVINL
jgi:26S proteasome regulatory subunit N7